MSYDISKKKAVETATMPLLDGANEPMVDDKGVALSITFYGPGSKEYQRAQSRRQNKMIERVRRKGKVEIGADESNAETADFLAACTVSFNGFGYEKLEGAEMFKACYADPGLGYIRDQAAEFIGEWANFTPGSAKS